MSFYHPVCILCVTLSKCLGSGDVIKIFREEGKIALYESKITKSFFFENENDREVAESNDLQTFRKLEVGYVGFWVQYKYEAGYGGQIRCVHKLDNVVF